MNNTLKGLITAVVLALVALLGYLGWDGQVIPPQVEPPDTVIEEPPDTTEPPDTIVPPDTTLAFDLSATAYADSVVLTWMNPPDTVQAFRLYRSPSGAPGTYTNISGDLAAAARRYIDIAVSGGQTWTYGIQFVGADDDGGTSNVTVTIPVDTTTEPPDTIPDEPPDTVGGVGDPSPDDWPDNEPAGMTTLTHITAESLDWSGWVRFGGGWPDQGPYPTAEHPAQRMFRVIDPDSKYGTAIEKRFFIGDVSGWGAQRTGAFLGPGYLLPKRTHDEVYVRIVFKISSNFDYHSGGNKVWLSNADGGADTGTSFYFRNATVYAGGHIRGVHITARQWRLIVPGSPTFAGGSNFGDGPFVRLVKGRYHTIEVWKRKSDPGVANGCLRVWFDDVEITRFSVWGDAGYLDTSLCGVEWVNTDGTSTVGVTSRIEMPIYLGGQNDVKEVDDHIRVAEMYVSARD